ncbi:MAG: ATP-dependent transcriptional regulator [Mycobacterium sp.]|nr:ATP-dependent transcriptional regulator [Mycobacterium sp.]
MVEASRLLGRHRETQTVTRFLANIAGPSALVLEGEPGIGKTTLWIAGVAQARERGFQVLAARPAAAESALSYSSLADLLGGVVADVWSTLPDPQRRALDHVLLRADTGPAPTDPRAVAAALVSVLQRLTLESPVLVAIDDLQWLDTSSTHAVAFAVRRLTGRVAVLVSTRSDRESIAATAWFQLPTPDALLRLSLQPLDLSEFGNLITERVGASFSGPTLQKIHELSGGNPFYGLELARSLDGHLLAPTSLPASLAEVVGARLGSLGADVRRALLAVACSADPTVELIAAAVATGAAELVALLQGTENSGIVEIAGGRVRFAHPLLERSVYVEAGPVRRRAMHARLADLVDEPETRARHLALAATSATPSTLGTLDGAAELARKRGAPAAAAELLELAVALGPGGDTPERRVRAAGHHVGAGNAGRARDLLNDAIARSSPGGLRAGALMLLAVVELFDNSFLDGVAVLERGLREVGERAVLRGLMLVTLSFALLNVGRPTAAYDTVEEAVRVATRSGFPPLLGQALGMRAMVRFVQGRGLDHTDLGRALELEDAGADIPIAFRPTVQNALLLGWSGQLDSARNALDSLRRACIQGGEEGELIFVSFHACFVAIWRGEFSEATDLAEDTVERARQLGGNVPLFVSLTTRAAARAYAGQEAEARSDLAEASAASARSGFVAMGEWPATVLGFLEVSRGNYGAALTTLTPLIARAAASPEATEINAASFIPDAVEALIQVGRADEAEPLIDVLHHNGRRLDRPWMLAVGGRCRSMLLAARGDIEGARVAAEAAMVEHQRIAMPFERARTLLTLGTVARRSRQEQLAAASFTEALAMFEQLGTPLWAARARAEMLSRQTLTPAEYRVARLTASGMTNSEVAAALFVSPKTVEFHLAGVYRKLGIRSRAELGRHMSEAE